MSKCIKIARETTTNVQHHNISALVLQVFYYTATDSSSLETTADCREADSERPRDTMVFKVNKTEETLETDAHRGFLSVISGTKLENEREEVYAIQAVLPPEVF